MRKQGQEHGLVLVSTRSSIQTPSLSSFAASFTSPQLLLSLCSDCQLLTLMALRVRLEDGQEARAVHGASLLSTLGVPVEQQGVHGLFDCAHVWLEEREHAQDGRLVILSPHSPALPASAVQLPLGRQRALWEAIPRLSAKLNLTLDPSRFIKARSLRRTYCSAFCTHPLTSPSVSDGSSSGCR